MNMAHQLIKRLWLFVILQIYMTNELRRMSFAFKISMAKLKI